MVAVGSKLVFDLRMVDCIRLAGGARVQKPQSFRFGQVFKGLQLFSLGLFSFLKGFIPVLWVFFVYWLPDEDKQAIYRFMAYPVLMSQHSLGLPLTNGGRNGQERQTAQEAKYTQV